MIFKIVTGNTLEYQSNFFHKISDVTICPTEIYIKLKQTLLLFFISIVISIPWNADAVTLNKKFSVNAVGACQSILPATQVGFFKSPTTIKNTAGTSAMLICALRSQGASGNNTNNPIAVTIHASVNNGLSSRLDCTGVVGFNTGTVYPLVVKSTLLSATGSDGSLTWKPSDFGAASYFPSGLFSATCNLNSYVGIDRISLEFLEDIGK